MNTIIISAHRKSYWRTPALWPVTCAIKPPRTPGSFKNMGYYTLSDWRNNETRISKCLALRINSINFSVPPTLRVVFLIKIVTFTTWHLYSDRFHLSLLINFHIKKKKKDKRTASKALYTSKSELRPGISNCSASWNHPILTVELLSTASTVFPSAQT